MKIYQTKDLKGQEKTWIEVKPQYESGEYYDHNGNGEFYPYFLFPITIKYGGLVSILIKENGIWSFETEREDGWYMAKALSNGVNYILKYEGGYWFSAFGGEVTAIYDISNTRIPDECLI